MRVRFLNTVPSGHPEYPFQAGQIIAVEKLTADMKRYIKSGWAVLLHDEPETPEPSMDTTERAVVERRKP